MPKRALTPCNHPGCPALTSSGYCIPHQHEAYQKDQQYRGTATQRGYDSKWARYSRQYRREHPICATCPNPTALVDHITPVTGPSDPLFWVPSNHKAQCATCHAIKTRDTQPHGRVNMAKGKERITIRRSIATVPIAEGGAWLR